MIRWILLVTFVVLVGCATPPPSCPALPDGLTPEVIEMCKAEGCTLMPDRVWEHIKQLLKAKGYDT